MAGTVAGDRPKVEVASVQQHEEAIRACRKQLKVIEQIELDVWPAHVRDVNAQNALRTAGVALSAALDSKPTRFPLKQEIAAWERAVQMAREGVAEANAVQGRLQQARERMHELEAKEFELRPEQERETAVQEGLAPVAVSHGLQGKSIWTNCIRG
jgi:hypothetical protein